MSSKLESPSAERNKLPIWEQVIQRRLLLSLPSPLPQPLQVLEVAAGSGVHLHFWAQQLAAQGIAAVWQSTDPDAASLASQEAYIDEIATTSDDDNGWKRHETVQFKKPKFLTLDAHGIQQADTKQALPNASLDWIWNINMIHISPWSATQGLMQMAGQKLKPDVGRLILYGPFRVKGTMVESNQYVCCSCCALDIAFPV